MLCERLRGGSILDCHCHLEGGGWLECPEAVRRPLPKLEEVLRTLPRPVKPVTLGWGSGRDLPTGAEFEAIVREVLRPSGQVSGLPDVSTQAQTYNKGEKMNMAVQARAVGFTGEFCDVCHSANMVRSGTCSTCIDCGATSGCS
jgi:hypothetical protein